MERVGAKELNWASGARWCKSEWGEMARVEGVGAKELNWASWRDFERGEMAQVRVREMARVRVGLSGGS